MNETRHESHSRHENNNASGRIASKAEGDPPVLQGSHCAERVHVKADFTSMAGTLEQRLTYSTKMLRFESNERTQRSSPLPLCWTNIYSYTQHQQNTIFIQYSAPHLVLPRLCMFRRIFNDCSR
jgi:hypothetical protein